MEGAQQVEQDVDDYHKVIRMLQRALHALYIPSIIEHNSTYIFMKTVLGVN